MVSALFKAEFKKLTRSRLLLMHGIIPLIGVCLFGGYAIISSWPVLTQLRFYFETLGIALPFLISLMASLSAEQEKEAGSYYQILTFYGSRALPFVIKYTVLIILLMAAMGIVLFLYAPILAAVGNAPWVFKDCAVMWALSVAGSFFLYSWHLFLSLRFGKGISVMLGVMGTVVSALFLTGMGNGIWPFVPCSWVAHLAMDYLRTGSVSLSISGWIAIVTVAGWVISTGWFMLWEGKTSRE